MYRRVLLGLLLTILVLARGEAIRYLRWQSMQPVIAGLAAAGEKLPGFPSASEWDVWIHSRDIGIRGQAERGVEDSISAFILFGGSFSALPRLKSGKDAVNAAGDLTPAARARMDAFIQALDQNDDERLRAIFEFLKRRRVTEEEVRPFLIGIIRRLALEGDQRMRATSSGDMLIVNFAIEAVLRTLQGNHNAPAHVRRVAVIGIALDFAGTPDHYDFHPPQAIAPFAIFESVLRLNLGQAGEVQLVAFDLSPFALAHLRAAVGRQQAGKPYVVQLSRKISARWNGAAVAYWSHFGDAIGTAAPVMTLPPDLRDLEIRAVAIKPQIASRISVEEMNVVAQTAETPPGQGFDLVVANTFASYDRLEQTLALASIAQMINTGGVLLTTNASPAFIPPEMEALGVQRVPYAESGSRSEIAVYRRK
jgi:hypothetical protein